MFEELKTLIASENVLKIRKAQRQIDNCESSDEQGLSDSGYSQEDQLSERLQMFKLLINGNERERRPKNTQNQLANAKLAQLAKEKQLLEEKVRMDQQHYGREMSYLKQKHERQIEALRTEIEKYQYQVKKLTKEEGSVLSLKKQNRQLTELYSQNCEIIDKQSAEIASLKKEAQHLKALLRQSQEKQAYLLSQKHIESDNQKQLKQQNEDLRREKALDHDRKKNLETSLQRLRIENEDTVRELDRLKMEITHQKQILLEKNKSEVSKLEQQNIQLKKRNQKLEESFIEHLTQTSLNLQQSLKHPHERPGKNTTLYLQQTPIKSRSKERERSSRSPQEEDPEKNQCSSRHCASSHQLQRLKVKLRQANAKIVQLLQQKCLRFRPK